MLLLHVCELQGRVSKLKAISNTRPQRVSAAHVRQRCHHNRPLVNQCARSPAIPLITKSVPRTPMAAMGVFKRKRSRAALAASPEMARATPSCVQTWLLKARETVRCSRTFNNELAVGAHADQGAIHKTHVNMTIRLRDYLSPSATRLPCCSSSRLPSWLERLAFSSTRLTSSIKMPVEQRI